MKTLIITFVLLFSLTSQASASDFYCAAIYPCDEDDNLMKGYSHPGDPCFSVYLSQCLTAKTNSLTSKLKLCESENEEFSAKNSLTKVQRKLKKAQRKIKKLKAQLR